MKLRHSVMLGLMGRQADRFHRYQPARPFEECLELAAGVKGADGVEVVYPQDFGDDVAGRVGRSGRSGVSDIFFWRDGSSVFTVTCDNLFYHVLGASHGRQKDHPARAESSIEWRH